MTIDSKRLRILLKDCANGFYQEMFFLGKDVLHPEGNQLINYGFNKTPSKGLKGTSCYGRKSNNQQLELYGSCAAIYSDTSRLVFLRERCKFYHWLPDHQLIAGQWSLENIESSTPEDIFTSLTPLLEWWVSYENWIQDNFGSKYRERCYKEWAKIKSRPCWLSPSSATEWVKLFIEQKDMMSRPKKFMQS